jgi:hypothetical protein
MQAVSPQPAACSPLEVLELAPEFVTHRLHVGDTQDKTYRIEDVGLARTIQTCDGIEGLVESCGAGSGLPVHQ